jgi:predicted nucleic acid-binding protein
MRKAMVIQDFSSKVVFLDTAPLIYFIEGHSKYQNLLSNLFDFNDKGGFSFITSSITLLEVLVKPLREGKADIAKQYRNILPNAPGIEVFDVTSATSEIAAHLRAQYRFRTPDAIQLAISIETGADYFLTNDNRLKSVSEIVVITVDELN